MAGTGFVYGTNFTGFCAAVQCAMEGPNVIWAGPSMRPGEMWGSGLLQTDREDTLMIRPNDHIRWGVLRDMETRFGVAAGKGPYLFPTIESFYQCMMDVLALYKTRGTFAGETIEHGTITLMMNSEIEKVITTKVFDTVIKDYVYPATGAILSGVTVNFDGFIDCSDELDMLRKLDCGMRMGREAKVVVGEPTAGVRLPTVQTRMTVDPITGKKQVPIGHNPASGQRRVGISPPRALLPGDADTQPMAFGERMVVTMHANRIKWADLDVNPNFSDYDVEYETAKGQNLGFIPASVSNSPMEPQGTYPQLDANNGGGGRLGFNDIGGWDEWFNMSFFQRQCRIYKYNEYKAGLFKSIMTDPRWAALPRLIKTDSNGNVTSNTHIVEDTGLYGLVPDLYKEKMWTGAEAISVGNLRWNGINLYKATRAGTTAATGGPTGTAADILDGDSVNGVKWTFVSPYMSPEIPWLAGQAVTVRMIRYNAGGMYWCSKAGTTASSGGPTTRVFDQTIVDGTANWLYMGRYIAGMSPHIYIREGPHFFGQAELRFNDTVAPEINIAEPITAAGYAHTDGHHVSKTARADGAMELEGFGGLDNGEENIAVMLPMKALMARIRDCPNALVGRGMSATRLGGITMRIELAWAKSGQGAGIILSVACNKGKWTGRVTYNEILPILIKRGSFLSYT